MLTPIIDHPLFQALLVFALTLAGKLAYDRWLATSARVTTLTCTLSQKACRDAIIAQMTLNNTLLEKQIAGHTVRLKEGEDCFENDRHVQRAILLTLLQMCNEMKIPCDTLTKVMVDNDVLR